MANISTSEFAAALDTDTRTVRKFLRSITPKDEQPGKGSRWVLEGNKRSLTKMKKTFDAWTEELAAKATEKGTEADPEADAKNHLEGMGIDRDPTDEEIEAMAEVIAAQED